MTKHTEQEVLGMLELVEENIELILRQLGVDNKKISRLGKHLIKLNKNKINELLDMPSGGTLPPEELAQMVVLNHINDLKKHSSEAAAAATYLG